MILLRRSFRLPLDLRMFSSDQSSRQRIIKCGKLITRLRTDGEPGYQYYYNSSKILKETNKKKNKNESDNKHELIIRVRRNQCFFADLGRYVCPRVCVCVCYLLRSTATVTLPIWQKSGGALKSIATGTGVCPAVCVCVLVWISVPW